MPILAYATQQTTNTTGTGTLTLNAVAAGRRSFQDAFGVSARVTRYVISGPTFREIGFGTYDGASPGTLTRSTVVYSTNSNALVSLAAGTWDVFPWIEPSEHGVVTGSGALTLTLADLGNAVVWSGGSNQTAALPAVAGVPDGSGYQFRNAGTAILTLDPAGTELVNGSVTLAMAPGAALDVIKLAGAWHAFFGPDVSAAYSAWGGTAGGSANALTFTVSPAPAAYVVGQVLRGIASAPNTGAATMNVTGPGATPLGAKNIKRWDGTTDIAVGDIPSGALIELTYDGTSFRLRPVPQGKFIGEEIAFFGSTLPSGVLWCAGQAVSRTTYAALFAVLATTYGTGDGTTTFNLPDMRGRAGFGRDDMNGSAASRITNAVAGITATTLGAAGGDQNVGAHGHTATQASHTHTVTSPTGSTAYTETYGTGGTNAYNISGSLTTNSATPAITVASGGTGVAGNIPPAIIRNVGIYAGV